MPVEAVSSLKGAGHFTLWFLVGYFVFLLAKYTNSNSLKLRIWGPFLPFALGTVAAIPYALQMAGLLSRETALHPGFCVVLLYPFVEQSAWAKAWLDNFHVNVVAVGAAYTHLLVISIRHIKRMRMIKRTA